MSVEFGLPSNRLKGRYKLCFLTLVLDWNDANARIDWIPFLVGIEPGKEHEAFAFLQSPHILGSIEGFRVESFIPDPHNTLRFTLERLLNLDVVNNDRDGVLGITRCDLVSSCNSTNGSHENLSELSSAF